MFTFKFTTKFKKDFKLCVKRNYDLSFLESMFEHLSNNGTVPSKYKPHKLSGNFTDCWECHIKQDWLLIWRIDANEKIVELVRTGTHSDLFG
jgi:mRNA interferase YafQ